MLNADRIAEQLGNVIFRLDWFENGDSAKLRHATGFFVTTGGLALTCYHVVQAIVGDRPGTPLTAHYKGQEIVLKWVLPGDADREWQKANELAVLQVETPVPQLSAPPCVAFKAAISMRGALWAGRAVLISGFASTDKSNELAMPGHVSEEYPVRDTKTERDGRPVPWVSQAVSIGPDYEGSMSGLRGISGCPVWDTQLEAIVGVVFGVQQKVYATELVHLEQNWPGAKAFVKTVGAPQSKFFAFGSGLAGPVWGIALVLAALLGWLLWPVRPTIPEKLAVQVVRLGKSGPPEKLTENTSFAEGERVRFGITPPVSGQLYVVDQEISTSGKEQPRYLIFPTRRAGYGRNWAKAGTQVMFPGDDDDPPYVESHGKSDPAYVGEELTVYVLKAALPLDLTNGPLLLDANQLPQEPDLPGLRPRIFGQPPAGQPLAVERIRVKVDREKH